MPVLKSLEVRRKVLRTSATDGVARAVQAVAAKCALSTKLAKTFASGPVRAVVFNQVDEDVQPVGDVALRTLLIDSESSVPRPQDGLSSVSDLELAEDRRQMVGDRFGRET